MTIDARTKSAATAHMMASLALQLVREDPDVRERYKALGVREDAPWKAEDVSSMALVLAEGAILAAAEKLMRHSRITAREMHIPIPTDGLRDSAQKSAGALAVGSMTTEFIHDEPGKLDEFRDWMARKHPDCGWDDDGLSIESVRAADEMLTLMAHAIGAAAEGGVFREGDGRTATEREQDHGEEAVADEVYRRDGDVRFI